ncbi:acyltransferase domain-containing protein [Dactylosporangium vinaceum]|uniref:Acyltransferase domain-containing protein n=1 Tax=Dactylosporangium vinaceum TaxID=53362 RepID=A0ABV5M374_9ACTN|nr:acyltransferase domain-containing protein [Dactylosporangium vinaceum]UAB99757.1 acyltransferase domain-containing protein [Dactylosporangium vinaceum]
MTPGPPVVLLLPGQGAQQPAMAAALYDADPTFTAAMDAFFGPLGAWGTQLRADWLGGCSGAALDDASRAQPLLYAVGYALGAALSAHGVPISGVLGHSVGELAAAALAGVFTPADGARLLRARVAALAGIAAGGMLAVAASPADLTPFLDSPDRPDGVVVGAENAPKQTVLAGTEPRLSAVEFALRRHGMTCRRIAARQPFHSPAARPAARRFQRAFGRVELRPPRLPMWSAGSGARLEAGQATDPGFWAAQLAGRMRLWSALDALLCSGAVTLVEAGPGQGLTGIARRHPGVRTGASRVVPLLPAAAAGTPGAVRDAVERLRADAVARPAGGVS